jgi:hypothetical protein
MALGTTSGKRECGVRGEHLLQEPVTKFTIDGHSIFNGRP